MQYIRGWIWNTIQNNRWLSHEDSLIIDNLVQWERYERERDALADKLASADTELMDTKKVFSMELGPKDHADRVKTAAVMRKDIEGSFTAMTSANETLNTLLEDDMKAQLGEQVRHEALLCSYKGNQLREL